MMKYTLKRKIEKTHCYYDEERVNKNKIERIPKEEIEILLIKTQLDVLTNMIENLNIGFARYSYPELELIDANNKAYSEMKIINPSLGTLNALIGKKMREVANIELEVSVKEMVKDSIEKKKRSCFETKKFIMSGEERYIKLMYQPLFGLNNSIIEITVISIDVTDEVKAKNRMEEVLKMQDQIFANVAHELKTPLNLIFSTNQLMEFYLNNDTMEVNREKLLRNVDTIKQNCYRFTRLINNTIDSVNLESGVFNLNLSNENIVQIIEDIVESVADYVKNNGLSIVFDTDIEEKIIACDPEKIGRIFLNLISNAVKFSHRDGKIFVTMHDKGDTIEIVVKDTGIGINNNNLKNIFSRFYQVDKSLKRKSEGCGTGLYIVEAIVKLHGGKISVDSELGQGSEFKIELPVRTVENPIVIEKSIIEDNKVKDINIEFSDIYSI